MLRFRLSVPSLLYIVASFGFHMEASADEGHPQINYVHEFLITLPDGIELSHQGATGVPREGYVFKKRFEFPAPSKYVIPEGTKILQVTEKRWEGLSFVLPDGSMVRPAKSELAGIEVRPPVEEIFAQLTTRSEAADRYCNMLKEITANTGNAPTLAGLHDMLMTPDARLTIADYRSIMATFITEQRPARTLDEIRLLRASLRDSITTFSAKWNVYLDKAPEGDSEGDYRAGDYLFLKDASKLRFDRLNGPTVGIVKTKQLRAYDGPAETVYDFNKQANNAVIHPLISSAHYFDWHHPLWIAKLINSEVDLAKSQPGLENFQNREAYPLEELVQFNGSNCVPLLEQETIYFLDPEKSYAYCGMESGRYIFDESQGKMVVSETFARETLEGHEDYGQGIWLPSTATLEKVVNGVSSKTVINYVEIAVNDEIAPELFTDVVPDGADVFDGVRGVAFVQGDDTSVSENLDREIVSREGRRTRKWLLVINAVAVIALGLYFVRRHVKRSGS